MSKPNLTPLTLAAVARPGDTIFIGLEARMCDEELTDFMANFENFTETTGVHVAVVEGATSMTVVRPLTSDVVDEEFRDWGED